MSANRIRVLLVSLLAVFAVSAVASGPAQAAKRPTYWHMSAAIAETFKIEDSSWRSRLWATSLGVVIRCEADVSKGEIEIKGKDKGEVKYTGCKVFGAVKKGVAPMQWEEGGELECTVKSVGGAAEEIKVTGLKSRLVYVKPVGGETEILTLFEPTTQPFVELTIANKGVGTCPAPPGNYPVKGKVLGRVPRINEEAIAGNILFETNNEAAAVKQRYTAWELPLVGAEPKEEEENVELVLGTSNKAALESTEQVELEVGEKIAGKRGLFDVHN